MEAAQPCPTADYPEQTAALWQGVEPGGTGRAVTMAVPRRAVQTIGDRSVVYVVNGAKEGEFLERTVRLGAPPQMP